MLDDNDRLPLTRSLESEVLAAFAVPVRAEALKLEALISALESMKASDRSLGDSLSAAGFMQASAEHQPVLDWIDAVFAHWANAYPLAPELQATFERARSLAAAFALKDNRFFIPGGHAMHRLLDVIHNGFIGWHWGLGGAASNALDGAREALERCRRDFPSEPQVDETLDLLSQKIQAHTTQLQRLDPVLLEREQATLGQDLSRLTAAVALNEIIGAHLVPGSVARFIKSDWFESGVQIVERHGHDSDEWQTFINTTQLLVDAVQPVDNRDGQGQERLQNAMHQLPNTLSRQLLSLQPDTDAIAGAIGLIEYALLRNMRGEDLGLLRAEPISVPGLPDGGAPSDVDLEQAQVVPGGWYSVDTADGELRVRLAGTLGNNLYLLFMDFLGARVFRKTWVEFKALLASGEARALNTPDSFCRAMVEATEAKQRAREAEHARQAAQAAAEEEAARRERETMASQYSGQHDEPSAGSADRLWRSADPAPKESPGGDHALSTTGDGRWDNQHAMPSTDAPYESNTVVKLQIPMGTWMGFHDREPPLMAKVAVRDLEKDSYIFTNREGIKLRELTVAQLIALIDRDMVDILERKTNFRETVNQMRRDQERLANA